jgi:hypothetical protein
MTSQSIGFAGTFGGDNLRERQSAGTKDFKIDHPLDPANKYLVHASVESSEMMNIYTGATIAWANWFSWSSEIRKPPSKASTFTPNSTVSRKRSRSSGLAIRNS